MVCPKCKSPYWDKPPTEVPKQCPVPQNFEGITSSGAGEESRCLTEQRPVKFPIIISIAMLLLAIPPIWPYGYYILLRLVVCGTSFYITYISYENKRIGWTVLWGCIGVLFNPIIPLYLSRELWCIVDLVVAIIFFIYLLEQIEEKERIKKLGYKVALVGALVLWPIALLLAGYFVSKHADIPPYWIVVGIIPWAKILYDLWKERGKAE